MHVYAPPFAQLVESPVTFTGSPMHIDTWHRTAMNLSTGVPFVAGPLPKSNLAPKGAEYSGLLECPVTSRIRKDCDGGSCGWDDTHAPTLFTCAAAPSPPPTCPHQRPITARSAEECLESARALPSLRPLAAHNLTFLSVHDGAAHPAYWQAAFSTRMGLQRYGGDWRLETVSSSAARPESAARRAGDPAS